MWFILYLLSILQLTVAQSVAINVADVPLCARDCLSNSTVVATGCASLNVSCLCKSPEFVSTFYCCLSTQCKIAEQATAIIFNQQQCAAVNATAPDFVGCSPLRATSLAGTRSTTSTVQKSNIKSGTASTVEGVVTEIASHSVTDQVTATFAGAALLTGSCTAPIFALASASTDVVLFPEIGCAPNRKDCCPFDISMNAAITKCPQDYSATANACCPTGYQVYSTALGTETPCYSVASTILIPATTPSISSITIITNAVFSRRYILVQPQSNPLSTSIIAAIVVVATTLVIGTAGTFWWVRHRNKLQTSKEKQEKTSFPAEEPVLPSQQETTSPQELESPEVLGYRSPIRNIWPIGGFSSPPAYEKEAPMADARNITPHELPGDTYINEHHPAFGRLGSPTELSALEPSPKAPRMSPMASTTASPAMTPVPEEHITRTMSPAFVSPLGSPRIPRTLTDQSIVSETD